MRAATRSGMSADEVYIPKLWCFQELQFLLDANDEVRGQSNLEINTIDDSFPQPQLGQRLKQTKRSRLDEVSSLRQTASKSMELVNSLLQRRSVVEESKEEIFCKMLCCELKELKFVNSYEKVTTEMLSIVRREKAAEREKLSWQIPRKATAFFDDPSSSYHSSPSTSSHPSPYSTHHPSPQSSSLHSSISSLEENNDESLHNETLIMETLDFDSLCNETFNGEEIHENNNEIGKRVEIQPVEVLGKSNIIQQAYQSILDESD